jgi:hypothetical protein
MSDFIFFTFKRTEENRRFYDITSNSPINLDHLSSFEIEEGNGNVVNIKFTMISGKEIYWNFINYRDATKAHDEIFHHLKNKKYIEV